MKKRNMLFVLPLVALLIGCGGNKEPSSNQNSSQPDSSESEPSTSESPVLHPSVTIADGERNVYITKQLTLTAEVQDSESAVVWTSSDTAQNPRSRKLIGDTHPQLSNRRNLLVK